ncbi:MULTISPECIES: 3-oxoacyl-ACP synthase III family protein [Asticcacaulis]|uniref:3-oxoacyl-ACP synthase III family protein n=1 Tax=Asticcacaulis TaxID=76890 RepID=UPI001AE19A4D|nr:MULTISPECIES: ketoacyl-ACP synthase III [Asticcacaulis]MBP2160964.1 3-oxoacyl-[acyl-carrier-protein] synthase-3 [Asticcacaulis solisilvae]MDR6802009.1 3-oxoacyl-[acyl-carrier-protein] synthase-3 [Asticcacaulis sp. BE141]
MTEAVLKGVSVRGIRACVPALSRTLEEEGLIPDAVERERLIGSIGVRSRRIARPDVMTSDLCQKAADGLIEELGWERDTIDVLIMVTQSADYVIPATACALQSRLGLGSCLAFDINLGCSGYAYGLWTAASLMQTLKVTGRPARALVLAGDVSTSKLLKDDRATVPLFGDAGSATALELDPAAADMFGVFGTDGSGAAHIMVEAGALRLPLLPPDEPHAPEKAAELFRKSRLHLNGTEVFNFTLKNVPVLVKSIFETSGATIDDIDYVLFHQANVFMLNHLRKKSGLPEDKVPVAMETYGNTSSASIPLTIADKLAGAFDRPRDIVLMGFGVGWSWSAMKLKMGPMNAPQVVELA